MNKKYLYAILGFVLVGAIYYVAPSFKAPSEVDDLVLPSIGAQENQLAGSLIANSNDRSYADLTELSSESCTAPAETIESIDEDGVHVLAMYSDDKKSVGQFLADVRSEHDSMKAAVITFSRYQHDETNGGKPMEQHVPQAGFVEFSSKFYEQFDVKREADMNEGIEPYRPVILITSKPTFYCNSANGSSQAVKFKGLGRDHWDIVFLPLTSKNSSQARYVFDDRIFVGDPNETRLDPESQDLVFGMYRIYLNKSKEFCFAKDQAMCEEERVEQPPVEVACGNDLQDKYMEIMKTGTPLFEEYRRALATDDEFDNNRLNNLINAFSSIKEAPGFEKCERIQEKCIDRLDADVKVPAIQGYCELPENKVS
jgi:hypothetical protein